jgi:hypothetical protein
MSDRQLILDTVEEICADTKDIDEVCMALEHSTIFIIKMVQDLVEEIDRLNNIISELEKYFAKPNKFIERPERMKILNKLKELKEKE